MPSTAGTRSAARFTSRTSRRPAPVGWRHRMAVLSRVLAAALGGYAFAAACTAALALALTAVTERSEAVQVATMLGFVLYALSIAWAFWARSAWRAWVWLIGPAVALGALAWLGARA